MAGVDSKVREFLAANPYAYLTVYNREGVICEGTVRSLSRIIALDRFSYQSFFAMSHQDGGVEAEAQLAV